MLVKAQRVERQRTMRLDDAALVEDAHDRVLAVDARHDRHPQVDVAAGHLDPEAAVLRDASLGDVEFGQHLEARDHLLGERHAADLGDRIEDAVETVLDGDAAGRAFEVDVAGGGPHCVIDGRVDEFHRRTRSASLTEAKLSTSAVRRSGALPVLVHQRMDRVHDSSCFDR
jgi:hypothetical protein